LLVEAHFEERQRGAQIYSRDRDFSRSPAVPLSTLIKRAINRVFAGAPAADDEAAPLPGFELVGQSAAATLSRRS
jgi:hypothetical protein